MNLFSPYQVHPLLSHLLSQHDELKAKFLEERAALEAKYEEMYQPFYSKRYDIVNGIVEAERVIEIEKDERDTAIGVPYFWLTAMKKIDILSQELSVRDEGALKYLKDIKYKKLDKEKGFKLEFLFDTNHYFKNTVLTKTYYLRDEKEAISDKAIGTEIEWYPGKCLTKKILRTRPKEGCQNAVPYTKTEVCASFFNFFDPPKPPQLNADIDQDIVEEFQTLMENDYEIGLTIVEKLIPNAVSWFLWKDKEEEEWKFL